jgi:2-polyprenyl-3-methyl-5-hydroxy-6-metoxy-1,4-benzoquinol methylase
MKVRSTFWDGIAEDYAKKPVANASAYARKLEVSKGLLRPEHRVLDIGCGTGSLALELCSHVAEVHALDFSESMIRIANDKARAQGVENVSFYTSTTDGPASFEPGSFDCVCAYNIFHLLPDRRSVLSQIEKWLVPGGVFISSTPCLGESWVPYGIILPVLRFLGKAPPVSIFECAAFESEITAAGFVNLEAVDVGASRDTAFLVAQKPA